MAVSPRTALLLVNLGTPDAPTPEAVRPYLKEFLSDPRVLSIPAVPRWLLLNLVILRTRPKKSAAAYHEVWTDEGSPLLVASQKLTKKVRALFDDAADKGEEPVRVELAMRYGNPSLESALNKLSHDGIERIVVFPLYPQYASATTGSTIDRVMELSRKLWLVPHMSFVPPFYDDARFLDAQVAVAKQGFDEFGPDHVLFSFHGVPESHITRGDPSGAHCLKKEGCCDVIGPNNRLCYRAHCLHTARGIAQRLGLSDEQWTMTFQSRLGKEPWLQPYSDQTVEAMAKKGVKRLAMFSPAFVADCLETLEELGMGLKETFEQNGGEAFYLAPCVNDDEMWAKAVVDIARDSGWLGGDRRAKALPLATMSP